MMQYMRKRLRILLVVPSVIIPLCFCILFDNWKYPETVWGQEKEITKIEKEADTTGAGVQTVDFTDQADFGNNECQYAAIVETDFQMRDRKVYKIKNVHVHITNMVSIDDAMLEPMVMEGDSLRLCAINNSWKTTSDCRVELLLRDESGEELEARDFFADSLERYYVDPVKPGEIVDIGNLYVNKNKLEEYFLTGKKSIYLGTRITEHDEMRSEDIFFLRFFDRGANSAHDGYGWEYIRKNYDNFFHEDYVFLKLKTSNFSGTGGFELAVTNPDDLKMIFDNWTYRILIAPDRSCDITYYVSYEIEKQTFCTKTYTTRIHVPYYADYTQIQSSLTENQGTERNLAAWDKGTYRYEPDKLLEYPQLTGQ